MYGLSNLAKMGDDSLDKMDPYQRGSRTMSMYNISCNYFVILFK